MKLPDNFIKAYPYPIAISVKRINNATEHSEKYLALAHLFETNVKYLASIAIAQYLRSDITNKNVQNSLKMLRRPTLGAWKGILDACITFFKKHPHHPFFIHELRDKYTVNMTSKNPESDAMLTWFRYMADHLHEQKWKNQNQTSFKNFLNLMLLYRNKTSGHGLQKLTVAFCKEHGECFLKGMRGMLTWMNFLEQYPLKYIKDVRIEKGESQHIVFDYTGSAPRKDVAYIGEYKKENRLYLCNSGGTPILTLRPLFLVNHRRMYALDERKETESIVYSECETGEPYEAVDSICTSFDCILEDKNKQLNFIQDPEIIVPPEEDGLEIIETLIQPSLANLITALSIEGRQALEIALGEALRLENFRLGIEFLLMGLSKQNHSPLRNLLHELGISNGSFRGKLRGMVCINTKKDWRGMNVFKLGSQALNSLTEPPPETSANPFNNAAERSPIITPRMMQILQQASEIAGTKQVDNRHLLMAAIKHQNTLPVIYLLSLAGKKDWESKDIITFIEQNDISDSAYPPLQHFGKSSDDRLEKIRREVQNNEILKPMIHDLVNYMKTQGIVLFIRDNAVEKICSPFMAEAWVLEDVAGAFNKLIEKPLIEKIVRGEFKKGDRVEVHKNLDLEIVLQKLEDASE